MAFNITNHDHVYKFALPLHDYLSQNGHLEEARALGHLVDSCFPNDGEALEAHRKAYREIKETVHDLPPQYQQALEAALDVLDTKVK